MATQEISNKERQRQIGIAAGYQAVPDSYGRFPDSYVKGTTHVWPIYKGWQNAQLIDGKYCYHHPCATLEEALAWG